MRRRVSLAEHKGMGWPGRDYSNEIFGRAGRSSSEQGRSYGRADVIP